MQLEEYSNRLGRYFHGKSLSREDTIGLILESRPEYVGIWLGLSKAGLVGALLNTNLRQDVLVHSIKAANCKAVIFGSSFKEGKIKVFLESETRNSNFSENPEVHHSTNTYLI